MPATPSRRVSESLGFLHVPRKVFNKTEKRISTVFARLGKQRETKLQNKQLVTRVSVIGTLT
jgi:hypothetical protein